VLAHQAFLLLADKESLCGFENLAQRCFRRILTTTTCWVLPHPFRLGSEIDATMCGAPELPRLFKKLGMTSLLMPLGDAAGSTGRSRRAHRLRR